MRDRADRLLAAALKARDDGNDAFADELTRLASEAIDEAADLENVAARLAGDIPRTAEQARMPPLSPRGSKERRR